LFNPPSDEDEEYLDSGAFEDDKNETRNVKLINQKGST
jgi:hypothetical protein